MRIGNRRTITTEGPGLYCRRRYLEIRHVPRMQSWKRRWVEALYRDRRAEK